MLDTNDNGHHLQVLKDGSVRLQPLFLVPQLFLGTEGRRILLFCLLSVSCLLLK